PAFQRARRRLQRGEAELSDRGAELLVSLRHSDVTVRLPRRGRSCPAAEVFGQCAAVVAVVVLKAEKDHERRPDIGVIRPRRAVDPDLVDARADHPEPGGDDLRLDVAVAPRETRLFGDAW